MNTPHTRIFLENVRLEIHVGHDDWEKQPDRKWPVMVTVEMFTERTDWNAAKFEEIINYAGVYAHLKTWESQPHVELLETLIENAMAYCFRDPKVSSCRVAIRKPGLFFDAAAAGVEVYRVR